MKFENLSAATTLNARLQDLQRRAALAAASTFSAYAVTPTGSINASEILSLTEDDMRRAIQATLTSLIDSEINQCLTDLTRLGVRLPGDRNSRKA